MTDLKCKKLPRNKAQTTVILARIAACKEEKEAKAIRKLVRAERAALKGKTFNPPRVV